MKDFTKYEDYGEIKADPSIFSGLFKKKVSKPKEVYTSKVTNPNKFAKENLDSGEIVETESVFSNMKKMFRIATFISVVVGIIIFIAVLTNPESVGEFLAKIVNGFTSNLK